MFCALYDRATRSLLIVATLTLAGTLAFGPAGPASAEQSATTAPVFVIGRLQQQGPAARLENASRIRALGHEIFAGACQLHAGIAPAMGRTMLLAARREMAQRLDALEYGDPALGVGTAEMRRGTLRRLHDVRAVWEAMRGPVSVLLDKPSDSEAMARLSMAEDFFAEASGILLSEVSGQYSNPFELMQADALAIDIAGRQAVAARRIARLSCAALTEGTESGAHAAELSALRAFFEQGVAAMHRGLPEMGLAAAPTPQIAEGWAGVEADWPALSARIDALVHGDASAQEAATLGAELSRLTRRIDKIASLYTDYARRSF